MFKKSPVICGLAALALIAGFAPVYAAESDSASQPALGGSEPAANPDQASQGDNDAKTPEVKSEDKPAAKADEPPSPEGGSKLSAPPEGVDKVPSNATETKKPYLDLAVKHYNRGVELHQSGFLNQAITEYKLAIQSDPRMEEAYSNIGLIYAAQRNYTKAIDAFNKALVLRPGRPTTLNGLGTVLYARGKVQEALAKWKQAIVTDPHFASAYYNMGNAYENEKDYDNAVDCYVKAIRINSVMPDPYYRIGSIYRMDKHFAQASLLLSRAVQLSPDADFARDARRQIAAIDGEFSHQEVDEPELQMNVLPPASTSSEPEPSKDASAESVPKSSERSEEAPVEKPGDEVLFRKPISKPEPVQSQDNGLPPLTPSFE